MSYLDWGVQDPLLREKERALHERLHAERADDAATAEEILGNPRLRLIPVAEERIGRKVSGRVLDIGCGNGYASAWLALNRPVEQVYALESTLAAVEHLIPSVMRKAGVPAERVRPTLGSFNTIPLTDYFDFLVAFGALHHSSDLLATLRCCHAALKPGGFLIAQEPTAEDLVSNATFVEKYESSESFAGEQIRNAERDDHFFRECEYKTALHFAGFELCAFEPAGIHMEARARPSWKERLFRTPRPEKRLGSGPITTGPRLIIARKPQQPLPYVPHFWSAVRP